MVREAYAADGRHPSNEAEGLNPQGEPLDLRGNADSLTQELAQLLAATIAQGKAGARAGTPTGSELASLAALLSSAQKPRPIAPSFRDGLSSLSYAAPQHAPVTPVQLTEQHPDDEPMPIPSTWREPAPASDDRWFRQQMGAAGLGLIAGLMVIVPAVLWLSGWFGGPQTRASTARSPAVERAVEIVAADVRPVRVQVRPAEKAEVAAQYVAASGAPRTTLAPVEATPAVHQQTEPGPSAEELVVQAERRIEGGDIAGARELLASGEASASGAMMFALAETYDPNMLAAWGVRGVTADVMKARSLYSKARDMGVLRAQMRLEQLK